VGLLISRDVEDKFLYGTLVLVNDYKCTKFQLPSCISFGIGDTVGGSEIKIGAADLKRSLADIFLYIAKVLINAYEFAKLSLPTTLLSEMECHNKKWELLIS